MILQRSIVVEEVRAFCFLIIVEVGLQVAAAIKGLSLASKLPQGSAA
jgi:hypothetical protein